MSDTHIILLRAVNVGGSVLPMAELRQLMTELGAEDVRTYIQSGNAVCVPPGNPDDFDRELEKAIERKYGFFREAIGRTPAELVAALAAYPFDAQEQSGEPKHAYIIFLVEPPTKEAVAKARTFETGADEWEIIGRDMHVRHEHGAGAPDLKTVSIAKALDVPGTSRNLNTVRKLIALAGD